MYKFSSGNKGKHRIRLLGSGTILREVIAAAEILENDYGVSADVWSVTSFNELRREGLDAERWNTMHPEKKPKQSYVTKSFSDMDCPTIAATDYMKIYADQIREFIHGRYYVLGTDGFGRSDTRAQLRRFFEVNRYYIAVVALKALADEDIIPVRTVTEAIKKFNIDPEKPNPVKV